MMNQKKSEQLEQELCALLNRHCVDVYCMTPDFTLAEHLIDHIESIRHLVAAREIWHGRKISFIGSREEKPPHAL